MNPAVVVIAYNRPAALHRLLTSLSAADYPEDAEVPLVISVDRATDGTSSPVVAIARDWPWPFGPKEVIEQPERFGLVRHFYECGRLSRRFGSIVLLEDDLVVAPPYHRFASQALARYDADERIAAVCLYALWFNGFTREPFQPLDDGNDVFFLRLPYTQGLAFTAAQWSRFEQSSPSLTVGGVLHPAFQRFREDEWFPAFAAYTATSERYVCFPRVSLTTGWGDAGAHFEVATSWLQTSLQLRGAEYRLPPFDEAIAVYDAFFELLPEHLRALAPQLPPFDFDVDLYATRQPVNLRHDYVLTTRPARQAVARFGLTLWPPELNLVQGVPGEAISFARREDVRWDRWAGLEARRRLHERAWARHRGSRRRWLSFQAARLVQKLRNRSGI